MEHIMAAEIWVATPKGGSVNLIYTPHVDDYPITHAGIELTMPPGYDPNAPNHPAPPVGPGATVIPILQGFNVSYGTDAKHPADHHVRELHMEVNSDGWHETVGAEGVLEQGPNAKVTVGLRDNSGDFGNSPPHDNSDDPYIATVYFSFLVIYP